MKKIIITILISTIILGCFIYIELNVYKLCSNKKESELMLQEAHSIIENSNITSEKQDYEQQNKTINESDVIGIIKIPKINIEAPIKEGTSQKIMNTCVGHFIESDLWNGNVSFASHNSGTSAHYFEKINLLKSGDEIIYTSKLGTRKYKVTNIEQIKSTDWSYITKNSVDDINTVTLITCINGMPDYRLCVRGQEI